MKIFIYILEESVVLETEWVGKNLSLKGENSQALEVFQKILGKKIIFFKEREVFFKKKVNLQKKNFLKMTRK